jgi:hypothetical protein
MMWPLPDDGSGFQGARRPPAEIDRDVRLTYEVADALLADERTRRLRVTVEVQCGVVLLSGTVHDQQTAEAATAVVGQVAGVRDVCNAVRTRARTAPEADRGALATSGQRDSEAFGEIVASLSLHDGSPGPPAAPRRRLPGTTQLLVVALILLPLAWLVLTLGWPGLLIACGVGAVMLEMNARRRAKRTGGSA